MMSRIVDWRPRLHLPVEVINLSAAGNCGNVSVFVDAEGTSRVIGKLLIA